jgi:hypothetical protein
LTARFSGAENFVIKFYPENESRTFSGIWSKITTNKFIFLTGNSECDLKPAGKLFTSDCLIPTIVSLTIPVRKLSSAS